MPAAGVIACVWLAKVSSLGLSSESSPFILYIIASQGAVPDNKFIVFEKSIW